MNTKIKLILFLLLLPVLGFTQGLIMPELPPVDTIETRNDVLLPEKNLTNILISGGMLMPELKLNTFELPKFDFKSGILNLKEDYSYSVYNINGVNNINYSFTSLPFTHSATVFNQAAYKLSDKFTFGGNSFGAQSIFSSPLPHPSMNKFDTRGASMFFEYKVSKNIKIETRISVTDRQF